MNKLLSASIIIVAINVLWLIGGQFWKPARRYGASICGALYIAFAAKDYAKDKKKVTVWGLIAVVFLGLVGLLSMGYGEDSKLKKWLGGSETLTRLVMAALIASVFAGYSIMTHHTTWGIPLTYGVNLLAWQIRAGSLCRIGKYDVLIEDIARATAFAVSLVII